MARAALALALATGIAAGGLVAAPAVAKEAKGGGNSKEFVTAAGPFQAALNNVQAMKGKSSDAEVKAAAQALVPQLATVEAGVKTPSDRLIFGQWQQTIGGIAGDASLTQKGLQNMLDSGQLPADKVSLVQFFLGATAYQSKDYATAAKVLQPVVAANYSDNVAAEMLAESLAQQGNPKGGLDALKTAIAARKAAGGEVPQDWYTRANRIAYSAKLGAETSEWATLMVQAFPTPINWLGATQLVRNASSYTNQETLDMGRLMDRTGALKTDPKYTEREFVDYIQAADPRRLPGEVVRIGEAGVAAGALKTSDTFVSDAMSQARGRIAADKASLPALGKDAASAPTGVTALAAADAYLSYGESAKAEEFYKTALAKGGIDKDRALTRLGIAQSDQAKYADAKASFAQVTGLRASMAKLWSIYVDQKAAGK
ncbi:hypothetical protein OLX02_11785 [Novosphingobium sp. KCTC 2891]|nr:hypothetical protein [Novosphingobium sp. KCTC 2891]